MNNKELMEKVNRIKGECPNFYITGKSVSALEKFSLQLAEKLEKEKLLPFKGIVRHFTIKMPYFDDMKSSIEFISRLKNSYSIARDCYALFCGIIIIEMSEEWAENGYNAYFSQFLDYLQSNPKVCFVILLPKNEDIKQKDEFFAEFTRCGLWMQMPVGTPSVGYCVRSFNNMARKHGFSVSDEAEELLKKKLEEREESEVENLTIVQGLIKQILFNRMVNEDENRIIEKEDISFISGTGKKTTSRQIGFVANYR